MTQTDKGPRKLKEKTDAQLLTEYATQIRTLTAPEEYEDELEREADLELANCIMNVVSQVGTYKAKLEQVEKHRDAYQLTVIQLREAMLGLVEAYEGSIRSDCNRLGTQDQLEAMLSCSEALQQAKAALAVKP